MVNVTRIAVAKHGEEPAIQEWPNEGTASVLHATSVKYGAWTTHMEVGQYGDKVLHICLHKIRLTYQAGVTSDVYTLRHVGYDKSLVPPQPPGDWPEAGEGDGYGALAHRLRSVMPGLNRRTVYPCTCDKESSIWGIIQHLNDEHHPMIGVKDVWTRERIADWVEALPFDLTIDPERVERLKASKRRREERTKQFEKAMAENGPKVLKQILAMHESALVTKESMEKFLVALNEEEKNDEHEH